MDLARAPATRPPRLRRVLDRRDLVGAAGSPLVANNAAHRERPAGADRDTKAGEPPADLMRAIAKSPTAKATWGLLAPSHVKEYVRLGDRSEAGRKPRAPDRQDGRDARGRPARPQREPPMRARAALVIALAGCHAEPVVAPANREIRITPITTDRDGDGIPDDRDRCPDQPEDFDAYQDEDGCPDPDDDGDACPRQRPLSVHAGSTAERLPGRLRGRDPQSTIAGPTTRFSSLPRRPKPANPRRDQTLHKYADIRGITIEGNREANEPAAVGARAARAIRPSRSRRRPLRRHDRRGRRRHPPVTRPRRAGPDHETALRRGRFRGSHSPAWGPVYKGVKEDYHCP